MFPTMLPEPEVELINWFATPYNNAVATARTCYAPRVVYPDEVGKDEAARLRRDAIAQSTYQAGHHTTIQHATFQFVLKQVSRHFIWSFLHSHPFYNSEQVSQRYVAVKPEHFAIPPFRSAGSEQHYRGLVDQLMHAYHTLLDLVLPTVTSAYQQIFPRRSLEETRWRQAVKKKQQEVARYVLPIATHAHLYHTVSGLTLHRYHRLCQQYDAPLEQRLVVEKMVACVHQVDPEFFKFMEDEIPLTETLEYQLFQEATGIKKTSVRDFIQAFDDSLGGKISLLLDYKVNAEKVMAESVRTVLGLTRDAMGDDEALDEVMNPANNHLLSESLNLTTMGKLTRAMVHPHFTFRKKLSHTADSQDQRHRMTPATRPILFRHVDWERPDYIVPEVIQETPAALAYYQETMASLWKGMQQLIAEGEAIESVLYLLPNAFPIRFEESGDLLNFHHKWTTRVCYTAQEEIWRSCWEEIQQIESIYPRLGKYLRPPCSLREMAGKRPYCPEGDRFCGVPVWKLPLAEYQRLI